LHFEKAFLHSSKAYPNVLKTFDDPVKPRTNRAGAVGRFGDSSSETGAIVQREIVLIGSYTYEHHKQTRPDILSSQRRTKRRSFLVEPIYGCEQLANYLPRYGIVTRREEGVVKRMLDFAKKVPDTHLRFSLRPCRRMRPPLLRKLVAWCQKTR